MSEFNAKLAIGIDLDDTLIHNKSVTAPAAVASNNEASAGWKLKRSARKYLPLIAELGYEFHLITARPQLQHWEEVQAIKAVIERRIGIEIKTIQHSDRGPKGYHATNAKCRYLVDDNLYFLSTCHQQKPRIFPILFGTRKQHVAQRAGFPCLACLSWREVYFFLRDRHGEQAESDVEEESESESESDQTYSCEQGDQSSQGLALSQDQYNIQLFEDMLLPEIRLTTVGSSGV